MAGVTSSSKDGEQDLEAAVPSSRDQPNRNGVTAAVGDFELEPTVDFTGLAPWDIDLDSWWTLNMFALDPQPLAGFDTGYL
jgi:hypothetical protein